MTILDTSILIKRSKRRKEITEDVTEVSIVEYPPLLEYGKFNGNILLIDREDMLLAVELQRNLRKLGKPKGFADLLISAICINSQEPLKTDDKDFRDIAKVSRLQLMTYN